MADRAGRMAERALNASAKCDGVRKPHVRAIREIGSVRNFVCGRADEHYAAMALMKRSPKMTANCAFAMVHSRGGILHSFSERFKIR